MKHAPLRQNRIGVRELANRIADKGANPAKNRPSDDGEEFGAEGGAQNHGRVVERAHQNGKDQGDNTPANNGSVDFWSRSFGIVVIVVREVFVTFHAWAPVIAV